MNSTLYQPSHNEQNKHKINYGISIGSASILVIFVILCLVSFATLSIVSANADYKLSSKVLNRTDAYYTACNQAEAQLAQIDQTLHNVYHSASDQENYFSIVGTSKNFVIPISDLQALEVSVDFLYPETDNDVLYSVRSFKVIVNKELDYDSTLPVYQ